VNLVNDYKHPHPQKPDLANLYREAYTNTYRIGRGGG